MHLSGLDLNLLRVFDVMLEERSVTRAGARLGLTQSAVSHALNRLRYHLDDELFQRQAQGMQPTRLALEIGPRLHSALMQLQGALTRSDFDPETSEQRFSLVAGAFACAVLMPAVVAEIRARAPNVVLYINDSPPNLVEQLDSGRVDLVVASFTAAPERFARERLMLEELAWVVRAGHPISQSKASLEDLVSLPHVVVAGRREVMGQFPIGLRSTWEDLGAFESELAKRGLQRRVGVVAPDVLSAMSIVACTEMVALVPRRFALISAQRGGLALIDPPYESPPVDVTLLCRRDRLGEPHIDWIRRRLCECAAKL